MNNNIFLIIKVSHKKAPPSFIDDAVKKIQAKKKPLIDNIFSEVRINQGYEQG